MEELGILAPVPFDRGGMVTQGEGQACPYIQPDSCFSPSPNAHSGHFLRTSWEILGLKHSSCLVILSLLPSHNRQSFCFVDVLLNT